MRGLVPALVLALALSGCAGLPSLDALRDQSDRAQLDAALSDVCQDAPVGLVVERFGLALDAWRRLCVPADATP